MPDGNARKIIEGGVDEIIVVTHATNGRVGIKTGDDWVQVFIRVRFRRSCSNVLERGKLHPCGSVGSVGGFDGLSEQQQSDGGERSFERRHRVIW